MLRYVDTGGRLAPTLTVVKTRGSEHDRRTHEIVLAKGGMRVGSPVSEPLVRRAGTARAEQGLPEKKMPKKANKKRR
jgi:circadian clock protein KaiC